MTNKILEGRCPKCQSESIEYGCMEVSDEGVYYPCTCTQCGCTFEEHYNLTFAGHAVDDEFLAV